MSFSLQDSLIPEAMLLGLEAPDAEDVIRQLGAKLFEAGYVRETFVEAALSREKNIPTGLPLGGEYNAAIPHTDVEHVLKPGVALGTLKTPVLFHSMLTPEETVNVRLVFVLALDQPKAQVKMLRDIAAVLQNAKLVSGLVEAPTPARVREVLKSFLYR